MNAVLEFPLILKPEQGGSGARMHIIHELSELETLLGQRPELWLPDNLLLLQEKLDYDTAQGIIRLEYIGGKLLYAMRVVTNDKFNLCPSVICNPEEGNGYCDIDDTISKPEFFPYYDAEPEVIEVGKKIMIACGHATGSVEYLITKSGRMVFYDINSNSNLRESIAAEFGKKAFDEVGAFLESCITSLN